MVYKYWDSITKEDLEFSVGSKASVWELSAKDPLLNSGPGALEYDDDQSNFHGSGSLVEGGRDYYRTGHAGYPPGNGNYNELRR